MVQPVSLATTGCQVAPPTTWHQQRQRMEAAFCCSPLGTQGTHGTSSSRYCSLSSDYHK